MAMASSNTSWGIEIGSGGVRAVKLQSDGDTVRLVDFVSYDHPKVLTTPELDIDDALRVAVGTLVSRHDLSNARISISLPGHQSFARFAKLPPVEAKKVPDIVKFEAVQQIPFPLADVEWDYQTFVSPDSPEVEVGIFAITRQRIMERLNLLADVGMTPDVATLSPIAVYNAFAYDLEFSESTVGTILLDIGTQATDLVIAHSGRVWVRTFPIGGHQFTEALVEQFKLPYSKAEKLKREAEQTKHARHVFQAMRPVFADLVQEVQRSVGYYQSLHPGADLKRLIGVGATFRLPGLRKFLKQQLQMDVYRLEQFKKVSIDGPRAAEFQTSSLNLATAYGLALQGLGVTTLEANLMPVKMIRDAMWKRKVGWFGAAAAVAAAASAALFIRPVLDSAAAAGSRPSIAFANAVNDANAAKAEATRAGVLTATEETLGAEQMLGLFDAEEIFGHLTMDVGRIMARGHELADASQIPSGHVMFNLERMSTEYLGGAGAAADVMGGAQMDPWGASGGRDEFAPDDPAIVDPYLMPGDARAGAWGGAQPGLQSGGGAASDEPEEIQSLRRIRVELVLTTTHRAPRDIDIEAESALRAWFKANSAREGIPYTIVSVDENSDLWQMELLDPKQSAPRPGVRPGGARGPQNSEFGGEDRFGGIPNVPGQVNEFDPRGSGQSDQRAAVDVDRVAPLMPPEEEVASGPTARFRLVFWAVLDEMTEGEGGDS